MATGLPPSTACPSCFLPSPSARDLCVSSTNTCTLQKAQEQCLNTVQNRASGLLLNQRGVFGNDYVGANFQCLVPPSIPINQVYGTNDQFIWTCPTGWTSTAVGRCVAYSSSTGLSNGGAQAACDAANGTTPIMSGFNNPFICLVPVRANAPTSSGVNTGGGTGGTGKSGGTGGKGSTGGTGSTGETVETNRTDSATPLTSQQQDQDWFQQESSGLPNWAWVTIGIVSYIILIIVIVLIAKGSKKKSSRSKKKLNRL